MIAAHHIPSPPLSEFVRVMWYWDGYVQSHAQERLLPDGSMTIAINLGEHRASQDYGKTQRPYASAVAQVVCGARFTYMVADTANMIMTFGIQFKPGGAFPFLRMPASELSEQCVSLECVFGSGVNSLRDRLLECETPQQKFAIAEQWLLTQAARPLEKHPAVEYATRQFVHGPTLQPLSSMLDRIGYSQRHFNQLFSDEVGLTPKRFLRVRRFQSVIHSIPAGKPFTWADVALGCGYYDQSHFAHEFRSFCGLTPAAYLSHRTAHLNHVPILD